MTIYDEIRAALAGASSGPWVWAKDHVSRRRLLHQEPGLRFTVLEAYVRRDGVPDCDVSSGDARLIALTPTTAEMALRLEAADRLAEQVAFAETLLIEGKRHHPIEVIAAALAAYRQKEGE